MSDFWTRRRQAVEAEAEAETQAAVARDVAEEREALEEKSDEEALAALDLPDPDGCDDPAVLRKFMSDTVPQRLKTRALRRMWRLNPMLANLDGLVDYGEDFTDASTVVENLATTYQVGKGMLKALLHETPKPVETPEDEDINGAKTEDEPVLVAAAPEPVPPVNTDDEAPAPLPRRMRFAFPDTTA